MPPKNVSNVLPPPWDKFLSELASVLTEPLELHCVGGFSLVHFYGLPRSTADIDYYTAIPQTDLDEIAGENSALHKKHKVYLHRAAVMSLPDEYESRLQELVPGSFKPLTLRVLDPYDCILSKIERNLSKDRHDADYLFRSQRLDSATLRDRYTKELRPYLAKDRECDLTLELWLEIFEGPP